ncbi:MAG: hypothetical protein HYV97_02850 [Bdellovibrio sp.]|nr:hypothetical protein [Bdellovibrio sp.]
MTIGFSDFKSAMYSVPIFLSLLLFMFSFLILKTKRTVRIKFYLDAILIPTFSYVLSNAIRDLELHSQTNFLSKFLYISSFSLFFVLVPFAYFAPLRKDYWIPTKSKSRDYNVILFFSHLGLLCYFLSLRFIGFATPIFANFLTSFSVIIAFVGFFGYIPILIFLFKIAKIRPLYEEIAPEQKRAEFKAFFIQYFLIYAFIFIALILPSQLRIIF